MNNSTLRSTDIFRLKIIVIVAYVCMFIITLMVMDSDSSLLSQLVLQLGTVISDLSPEKVKP